MTDLVLIIIFFVSVGYVLYLVVSKFPQLANITLEHTPEEQQRVVRHRVIEEKLRKDLRRGLHVMRTTVVARFKDVTIGTMRKGYDRLRELEREYRYAVKHGLQAQVTVARSIDDQLAEARTQLAEDHYPEAEKILIEVLKLDEHNAKAYGLLAEVYQEMGDYDHARETLEFLLHLTNDVDASVHANLATLASSRGDYARASEHLHAAIARDPDVYRYHIELADVYRKAGTLNEALVAAQRALSLVPNNPRILDFLIETSILLQDRTRAEEYLAKLIEANPQNAKIPTFTTRIRELKNAVRAG